MTGHIELNIDLHASVSPVFLDVFYVPGTVRKALHIGTFLG